MTLSASLVMLEFSCRQLAKRVVVTRSPMAFTFDGKNIIVDYKTIVAGANYFSKVVEKMVLDPVSHKKVSNLDSRSYLYYGRTYFFESNETQAKFEANPEKYVETNGTLK